MHPAGSGQLDATVKTRLFLGTSWRYQLQSPLGDLQVTLQNSGHAAALEGDVVGLDWQAEAVRLLRQETPA